MLQLHPPERTSFVNIQQTLIFSSEFIDWECYAIP